MVDVNWLTTAEAADVLGICQSRVQQLVRKQKLPAQKKGTLWLVQRGAVQARLAERLAAEPPPNGYLFRMALPGTAETALTDIHRCGGLRYAYHTTQWRAVAAMRPGDRLAFPEDEGGPEWTIECMPAMPKDVPYRWRRLDDSHCLTLDDLPAA